MRCSEPMKEPADVFDTLLSPTILGRFFLSHRVVLAPMTRCRALNNMPQPSHIEYYQQRATPSGLLITEGVAVSAQGIGFPHCPGIYNERQVKAWKAVTEAVHKKGGIIFCQLWHVGRASHTYYQPNGLTPISSTSKPVPAPWTIRMPEGQPQALAFSIPHAASRLEIVELVEQFRVAARNAIAAGFDGVEVHAAHGYLIDQFFKDGINDRTDEYGGSVENRCRMGMEVVAAVTAEIGADRTGVRISPIIDHLEATDSNPSKLGLYLVERLNKVQGLAYLHLTEPRFTSQSCIQKKFLPLFHDITCKEFAAAFKGVVMVSGGYTRESGMEAIKAGYAQLVAYGRLFISNPDLPMRFALNAPLGAYDRSTFYSHHQSVGFTDYPPLSIATLPRRHHHQLLQQPGHIALLDHEYTASRSNCSVWVPL